LKDLTKHKIKPFLLVIISTFLVLYSSSQTVFKTPSGAKYHLASCRMVKNVSEEITVEKAIELGLTPCKICNPENIYAGNIPNQHKAQGQNISVQCKGVTKSGSRCRHRTSIANGYCFQHQPE